ncbi:MAG: hypothetical protein FJ087_05425 [Deltaproteobacteria bacterium]|nr:hypothetical protein [Deltaproteobacteria bacterium]
MLELRLDHVKAAQEGDGGQVSFDDCRHREPSGLPSDSPCFLSQRHFEEPDDGSCYVETLDESYCGHYRVLQATLSRDRLYLRLRESAVVEVSVWFATSDQAFARLRHVLKAMIPHLVTEERGRRRRDRAGTGSRG